MDLVIVINFLKLLIAVFEISAMLNLFGGYQCCPFLNVLYFCDVYEMLGDMNWNKWKRNNGDLQILCDIAEIWQQKLK
jgi:hypothetical protein